MNIRIASSLVLIVGFILGCHETTIGDNCRVGEIICDNNSVLSTCVLEPESGGTVWEKKTCQGGCVNNQCNPLCTADCKTKCDQNTGKCECNLACSNNCSEDGTCSCVDESFKCFSNKLMICKYGNWQLNQTCSDAELCSESVGACVDKSISCIDGDRICSANAVMLCQNNEWIIIQQCSPEQYCDSVNYSCAEMDVKRSICGNNLIEPGEVCDGHRLNDQTCETILGHGVTGRLGCQSNCLSYDFSECRAVMCGDCEITHL